MMARRYVHLTPAQMGRHAAVISVLLYDTTTSQDEPARNKKELHAAKHVTLLFYCNYKFWLPDLDSNQGPAD